MVLPAPFSPRRPRMSPSFSVRSTPDTACTGPKRLEMPRIETRGGVSFRLAMGHGEELAPSSPPPTLEGCHTWPEHGAFLSPREVGCSRLRHQDCRSGEHRA